jgi:hypothetical protein
MAKKKSMMRNYGDAAEAAAKAATGYVGKSVALPEGMSFMPMKVEKEYRLRFAPYLVGKGNPEMPEGSLYYTRKYYAHARIGVGDDGKGGDTYVCSRRTFGKPCAVCDLVVRLRSNPNTDPQLFEDFKVKERQLFIVRDNEEKDKGWRILDMSYHALGKQLEAKLKASRNAGDEDEVVSYQFKHFFYLEGGAVVKVLMEDPKLKFKFLQAKNIEIVPTKEVLDDEFLDGMPCLDDILIETPYKVLEKVLTQGDAGDTEDEEEETPAPKKKGKAKPVEDDDEEEEVEVEDEDDDLELDDDDEEETPAPKKGAKIKKGDQVEFDYRGKTFKGVVLKVNDETDMVSIKTDTRDLPHTVELDEVRLVKATKGDPKPGTTEAKTAAKKGKAKPVEDDDDDLTTMTTWSWRTMRRRCRLRRRRARRSRSRTTMTDDMELEDDDNVELEDDDEDEEPAPKKKGKPPTKSTSKPSKSRAFSEEEDDEDFDVEDDEEEEMPAPKKKGKK